jgi:hypothetical protein
LIKARIELRLGIKKAEHLLDIPIKIVLQAMHQVPGCGEKMNHRAHGEGLGGGPGGGLCNRFAFILVDDSVVDTLPDGSSIEHCHIVGRRLNTDAGDLNFFGFPLAEEFTTHKHWMYSTDGAQ